VLSIHYLIYRTVWAQFEKRYSTSKDQSNHYSEYEKMFACYLIFSVHFSTMKLLRKPAYLFLKMHRRKIYVMWKWSMQIKNRLLLQLRNSTVCTIFKTFQIIQYSFFYIDKHIPQWKTRLLVSISDPKKRNLKDAGKGNTIFCKNNSPLFLLMFFFYKIMFDNR